MVNADLFLIILSLKGASVVKGPAIANLGAGSCGDGEEDCLLERTVEMCCGKGQRGLSWGICQPWEERLGSGGAGEGEMTTEEEAIESLVPINQPSPLPSGFAPSGDQSQVNWRKEKWEVSGKWGVLVGLRTSFVIRVWERRGIFCFRGGCSFREGRIRSGSGPHTNHRQMC